MLTFIKAYTLACMEHAYHVPFKPEESTAPLALASLGVYFDPNDPTKHQLAFAHMFQVNIDDFVVLHGVRNEKVCQELVKYLDRVQGGPVWASVSIDTQALFDWCVPDGAKQLKDMTEKVKKKHRGKRKRRTQPDESGSDGDVPLAPFKPVLPKTFTYDAERIREHCMGNLLLQGLVEPMSYVRTTGGEEEDETMDLGKTMELPPADKSYEKGLEDMMLESAGMTIDGANVGSLVTKRDS
jgi:hypothetical protein